MITTHEGRRQGILAIDTATSRVAIVTGSPDGVTDGLSTWVAGYRHGETLLPSIGRFLDDQELHRSHLVGIIVGTGPGTFTGLRVGMATAKGLAHGLAIPLVGVSTAEALLAAASPGAGTSARYVLLVPAGTTDRVIVRPGQVPAVLPGGQEPDLAGDEVLVAVDLAERAPADAVARGDIALAGLGPSLLRLGAERLRAAGMTAAERLGDLATLVPEYVTLPRGTAHSDGVVAWSRDPR